MRILRLARAGPVCGAALDRGVPGKLIFVPKSLDGIVDAFSGESESASP